MQKWSFLTSSNIRACCYFRKTQLLVVLFRSQTIYVYGGVPWGLYLRFRRAPSHGAFFARKIRFAFPYQKVSDPNLFEAIR